MKTQADKTVSRVLLECKWEIFIKFLASIFVRGMLLIIPIYWSRAIDTLSKSDFDKAITFTVISLILTIIYYISEMVNQHAYYRAYNKTFSKLTKAASEATVRNSMYSLSRFSLSEYTNIMINDITAISTVYSNTYMRIVQAVEFIVIYIYFLSLNIFMFIVTIIISIIMLILFIIKSNRTSKENEIAKKARDEKTVIVHESFNGMKEIKGFNVFSIMKDKIIKATNKDLKSTQNYTVHFQNFKFFVLSLIEIARYGLIVYGIYLISKGKMELGTLLVIYNYYAKIITNFDMVGTIITDFKDLGISKKRFNKILEYSRSSEEGCLPVQEYKGAVEFTNVLYGDKNDPILTNTSFTIAANSITIITGPPSTGKTGIFDLLLKMNRIHNGLITIDNNDIDKIDDETYYNLISVARKDPHFFDLSIRENLTIINDDFDKIVDVCKRLGIHETIMSLPEGYETSLSTRGENISSNVRKLLAIARVLIKDSKIMLFDDLIGYLEKESQITILNILDELSKDHTIVIISKERDIMEYGDEVIIMSNHTVKKELTPKQFRKLKQII